MSYNSWVWLVDKVRGRRLNPPGWWIGWLQIQYISAGVWTVFPINYLINYLDCGGCHRTICPQQFFFYSSLNNTSDSELLYYELVFCTAASLSVSLSVSSVSRTRRSTTISPATSVVWRTVKTSIGSLPSSAGSRPQCHACSNNQCGAHDGKLCLKTVRPAEEN